MSGQIEVLTARSGHQVIKKDGKYLSSSVAPMKEAATWALQVRDSCAHAESVFLLGAGSLYHARALVDLIRQPLIVIDCDQRIVEQSRSWLASAIAAAESSFSNGQNATVNQPETVSILKRIHLVYAASAADLIQNESVRQALLGTHVSLRHVASCQQSQEFFAAIEQLLVGRDEVSFLLQLKTRPELCAILSPAAITQVFENAAPSLVSIKTMQKLFLTGSVLNRERRIWRTLEELIR